MSYDLSIHFDSDGTKTAHRSQIENVLEGYPGVKRVDARSWVYEPKSSVHAEFDLVPINDDDPDAIGFIGVGIPYPYLSASGELTLVLCFTLAEQLGWRVYDEQIGDYIDPADMKSLVTSQEQFLEAANAVLPVSTWFDDWASAAKRQSLLFLIIAMVLAAIGAIALVLQMDVPEDKTATYLFWIGLPIVLAIFSTKITFDAWRFRRGKTRR